MKHSDPLKRATEVREIGETWDDDQFKDAREQDLRQRTADARSAVIAALTCLLLAMLLTSAKIVEIAERQEFGDTRDRQVAVAERIDRVANFLSLNRPYDLIQDIRGAGDDAAQQIDSIDDVAEDLGLDVDVPDIEVIVDDPADPAGGTTTTSPTTTTTVPSGPLRTVDGTQPLAVFVGGDSQAEYLGDAITTESGFELSVEVQHEISTSLARPDYFNWPARLAEVVEEQDPEAVVFFIGANDHQDMADDEGNRLVEGSEDWQREWTRRLAITFDLLEADDRRIFWVTQPPMRDGGLDDGINQINALAAAVIAERDFVTSIDIWPLFGGESGFSERVVGPDGDETRARIDDGVHLTRAAASWVADMIFADMSRFWDFS
jgi:lysophospholipase L1-like esterase